jgi:hypothetical protein
MNRRVVVLLAAALLGACARPAPIPAVDAPVAGAPADLPATAPLAVEEAVVADQPLPEAVEASAEVVAAPVAAAIEALTPATADPPPPPVLDDRSAACRRAAASLIIRWEVSSEARYNRALQFPIWPGGASGVTWGIGYDGGHQPSTVIADDWQAHAQAARLATTAGIRGASAKSVLPRYRDIPTAYGYASQVFEDRSLIEYERRTRRAFGDGFDALRPNACAAMVSLVYNRGAAMTGDSRREMRALRDDCISEQDYSCMAKQLRSMKRLWRGTVNENGLSARREAEALLVETP